MEAVPVIDLSGDERRVAVQVGQACEEIGFLTVVGHGVEEAVVERLATLSRAFFDLPTDEKLALARRADFWSARLSAARERKPGRELGRPGARRPQGVTRLGPGRAGLLLAGATRRTEAGGPRVLRGDL